LVEGYLKPARLDEILTETATRIDSLLNGDDRSADRVGAR
jgi:hypothetical protein